MGTPRDLKMVLFMAISHLYFWSILQFLFIFLRGSNFSFLLLFHLRKNLSHLPLLLSTSLFWVAISFAFASIFANFFSSSFFSSFQ